METTCQRCNEAIREADRYCAACGLPHLIYVAAETPAVPFESLDETLPAVQDASNSVSGIAWRPALNSALMVAVPTGVLCSGLTPIGQSLGLVWMIGAAAWAVSLYARRTRIGGLSMAAGARIGLVTGLLTSWLTLAVNSIALWFARFVLHQGGQMDSLWLTDVEKSLQMSQQMVMQMGMASTQAAQSTQLSRAWMLSAEGRAGIALVTFLMGTAFLIIFATVGGAAGARLLVPQRRPNA